MKTVSLLSVVSLIGLLAVCSAATDYCAAGLCSGSTNIGCGNTGAFGLNCPQGLTQLVAMPESLKAKILDSHNSKRNLLANGQLPGFRPAERMATMKWDTELAYLAELNVKKCLFQHDACHNTNAFRYSGQNLGQSWWYGSARDDGEVILELIDSWWSEYKDATQADVDKYPTSTSKTIGHFTVMTADKNIALGCAAIKFPEGIWSTLTVACNYATTNIIGRALYTSGNTASKCISGRNPSYSGLCSLSEVYNVNAI